MADEKLPHPRPFAASSDPAKAWKDFRRRFELYLTASGLGTKDNARKVALLLTVGGENLIDVYDNLEFPARANTTDPDPKLVLDTVLQAFERHFAPRSNPIISTYEFQCYTRPEGMSLDVFINNLQTLSRDCEFGAAREDHIRNQLVFGCSDPNLRQKFFEEYNKNEALTLATAVKICKAYEVQRHQAAVFGDAASDAVHRLRLDPYTTLSTKQQWNRKKLLTLGTVLLEVNKFRATVTLPVLLDWTTLNSTNSVSSVVTDIFGKNECPAYGKKCGKCSQSNHFAKMCELLHASAKYRSTGSRRNINTVVPDDYSDDDDQCSDVSEQYVLKVTHDSTDKVIFSRFKVGEHMVKFQIDSGASVNILPKHFVDNVCLTPSDTKLFMYNNTSIFPLGKCRLSIRNCKTNSRYNVEFQVVENGFGPILGKKAAEQMKLITVNYENICNVMDITNDFPEVFSDRIGSLPGLVHLTIDPSVTPVAVNSCRIPLSLQEKVKSELCKLEAAGVIAKVDRPTDWVNRMVVGTKKTGDLRICIDPQALNKALKRELYPLPLLDDILPKLSKARVFSCFDLKHGYWHCKLDEESSYLTTFQTPLGRYRWMKVPFGMAVSSEIFQKKLNTALDGLDGVFCVADDILVYGEGENDDAANVDHDKKVRKLLERCHDIGIVLNRSKTSLRTTEISFLGHKISKDGIKPDPDKVKAITMLKAPTDVTDIQRLSGMVNYLARFLPKLSDAMEPIRRLTVKDVEWNWGEEQKNAFAEVKKLVATSSVLAFYDPAKPLEIQCDASQTGLGAVLLQEGKPIYYASRALTPTETRYAQIEKEMLAVVFALTKFHQYTFGRMTTIRSDHKPLQAILKKPIDRAPRRLQGMLMRAYQYHIELVYQPGKSMHIADLLSRNFLPENGGGQVFESINMVSFLPVRPTTIEKIRKATVTDDVMKLLSKTIMEGWPEDKSEVPHQILPYFTSRDEFSVQNGLIFKGERVLVPPELRTEIKKAIHASHIGVEGCLRRARECVFWPGMNTEVKEYIALCETCNKYNTNQRKETLIPHDIGDRPWDKVGVDLCEFKNQTFLITVDYFSNFWEIDVLDLPRASQIIRKLKAHFARYGIPSVVMSDNGPQFTGEAFQKFAKTYEFLHKTSSPHYPRSNGMAESAVKTAKTLLMKATDSGRDPYLAILDHRNTPSQDMGLSPAQRSLGRRTRTLLPMSSRLLQPRGIDTTVVKKMNKLKNMKSAWYHDRTAKDHVPLNEGDTVRIKPSVLGDRHWKKGVVSKRLDDRSYEVQVDGTTMRRNKLHLRKSDECAPRYAWIGNRSGNEIRGRVERDNDTSEVYTTPTNPVDTSMNVPTPPPVDTSVRMKVPHSETTTAGYNLRPKSQRMVPNRFKDYVLNR